MPEELQQSDAGAQRLSQYPAIAPPVPLDLWQSPPHPCPYIPGRLATMRAFMSGDIAPEIYHAFMDANFRRSGRLIYQPTCAGCRACQSLRVVASEFVPSKSQRRCLRKNADLVLSNCKQEPTQEKYQLYRRYQLHWHGKDDASFDEFKEFLYDSPVQTLDFEYRDVAGKLLAVGVCDVSRESLSSVYFYFDPSECKRRLGTFGAVREIQWAASNGIPYYYLGYWVGPCSAMRYKATFDPHQVLDGDGVWRTRARF